MCSGVKKKLPMRRKCGVTGGKIQSTPSVLKGNDRTGGNVIPRAIIPNELRYESNGRPGVRL